MTIVGFVLACISVVIFVFAVFVMDKSEIEGAIRSLVAGSVIVACGVSSVIIFGVTAVKDGAKNERAGTIELIEAKYLVKIDSFPEDLTEPALWVVNGESLNCYVVDHPVGKTLDLHCGDAYDELPTGGMLE